VNHIFPTKGIPNDSIKSKSALATLDGADGFTMVGRASNDALGYALSSLGDINGDGLDDFIVGARAADPGSVDFAGEAYVVFGQTSSFGAAFSLADLDGSDGFRIEGITAYDYIGGAVSSAGDFNGDGIDDILLGASGGDVGGNFNNGESYILFGSTTAFGAVFDLDQLDATEGSRLDGITGADQSGRAVADVGDVNGDGFADVLIGAPFGDPNGESGAGESYVVFGGLGGLGQSFELDNINGQNGFVIQGAAQSDRSGDSVAGLGDINGDGLDDIIVGAELADPPGRANAGAAIVVLGQSTGFAPAVNASTLDGTDGFLILGAAAGDILGRFVASAGDFNGDGFMDILVGAQNANASATGAAFVVFGSGNGFAATIDLANLDGSDGVRINGISSGDGTGDAVSAAGDVNGDGLDDILIGSPGDDNGGLTAGSSTVLFGSYAAFSATFELSTLDATEGFRIDGADSNDKSGSAVSAAGDINGDGLADILVGGPSANGSAGESNVIFGTAEPGAIVGTSGNDTLNGNGQNNTMILGAGDDVFNAGAGDDVVRGGAGRDTGSLGSGDDLAFGGAGDDILNGSLGDDVLFGEDGTDRLILGGGADAALGGDGTDLIFERADQLGIGDQLFGGLGVNDTLVVLSSGVLDLTSLTVFNGIERVRVAANQQITSTDDDLNWTGRSGAENYGLGDGRDIVRAGGGADIISGGGGNDTILAQGGDDIIQGGAGTDRIVGSVGADTFVFAPGMQIDIIFDYADGTDQLDVSAFGFTNFTTDVQPRIDTVNGKAVLDLANGDRVILNGVSAGDLDAGDFILA